VFELALLLGPTEERKREGTGIAEFVQDLEDQPRRGIHHNRSERDGDGGVAGAGQDSAYCFGVGGGPRLGRVEGQCGVFRKPIGNLDCGFGVMVVKI